MEVALPDRPRIPTAPRSLRGNLGALFARALLVGLRYNTLFVVLQPFVLSRGGSVALLGLLETVGGYRGLVPTLVQPAAGWLADQVGRKRVALAASVVTVASMLLFAVAGGVGAVALLLPAAVLVGLNAVGRPALDALVVESVVPERVGRAYSLISFGWAVAGVIASLGAGLLAERAGYVPVFVLTAALETVGTLLLAFGVRETLTQRRRALLEPRVVRELTLGWILPPARLRAFYLAVVIDSFAYGVGSLLLFGFLADRFGYTPFQFGVMATAFSISWMLMQLPAGRWTDRGRAKDLLVIGEGLDALVVGTWLLSQDFGVLIVTMAVLGVVAALWTPALVAWIAERVPEGQRAQEMGRLSALPGLFAFPAPYLGALLYERWGFAAPIALNLAGVLVTTAVLVWGVEGSRGYNSG